MLCGRQVCDARNTACWVCMAGSALGEEWTSGRCLKNGIMALKSGANALHKQLPYPNIEAWGIGWYHKLAAIINK